MKAKRKTTGAGGWGILVLILLTLFFSPAVRQTFIFRDAFNLFYPFKVILGDYWRQGEVCLWDCWQTMGSPFVGELGPGWFYPGNAFYLFFSAGTAFRLFIVSHYLLAGFFMWAWLRSLGTRAEASAAAALSYSLSGYVLTQHGIVDMLVTCAWLPGSLWLLTASLQRRSPSLFLLFAATLTLPFLAGRAEGTMINGLAAAGWLLLDSSPPANFSRRTVRMIKLMAAAGVAAALFSMVQLLPSLELGRLSIKGAGYTLAEVTTWSFHPFRLLEFLLPSPWGRFWPRDFYCAWELTGWEGYYPWSLTAYLGIPLLLGAALALARAPWQKRFLASGLLAIALFLSLGRHTPFYTAAALLPPFRIFRFPEKYLLLVVFMLSAAGGRGLHLWLEERPRGRCSPSLSFGLAGFITISLLFLFILAWGFPFSSLGSCITTFGPTVSRLPEHYLALQFAHPLAVLFAFAFLSGLRRLSPLRAFTGPALVLLTFADLSLANSWVISYGPKEIYEGEPAILSAIRAHASRQGLDLFEADGRARLGHFRLMREPHLPDEKILLRQEGNTRLERYRRWERDTLMENFNYLFRLEHLTGYSVAATADFNRVMHGHLHHRTMALYNVVYALTPAEETPLEEDGLLPALEDSRRAVKVFYLPHAFPRAYLIGKSHRVLKAMESLDLLESHNFRQAVVLENHPALPPPEEEGELPVTPAEIISYEPDEVRLRSRAETAAYLVLSDLYYPGWKAVVDGTSVPIFRANFLVRAVRVPAGEHEIVFRYRPASYLWGRAVSLASLAGLAGLIGWELGRRRRKMRVL